jgi:hypothetical protein
MEDRQCDQERLPYGVLLEPARGARFAMRASGRKMVYPADAPRRSVEPTRAGVRSSVSAAEPKNSANLAPGRLWRGGKPCACSRILDVSESGPIPYPLYELLTANGITEIIEHRRMEPVFYITDNPEVSRKLGVPD